MDPKRKQVAEQCRAVAHLATVLAQVNKDYASMFADEHCRAMDELVEQVGKRTALHMEAIGDILNGMDAVDDSEEWTAPIFAEAQRLWPSSALASAERE